MVRQKNKSGSKSRLCTSGSFKPSQKYKVAIKFHTKVEMSLVPCPGVDVVVVPQYLRYDVLNMEIAINFRYPNNFTSRDTHLYLDIPSDILSGILSGILSDSLSDILSDILFSLAFFLTYILALHQTFFLTYYLTLRIPGLCLRWTHI